MKNYIFLLFILTSMVSEGQWSVNDLGTNKNNEILYTFSSNETYLLSQNIVLKSTDSCKTFKQILSDTGCQFKYLYKYNSDSIALNCRYLYSQGFYGQKLYRYYADGKSKLMSNFSADYFSKNITKFDNDTFLTIYGDLFNGLLGVCVTRYPFDFDVLPYPQTYAYLLYYVYHVKFIDYKLLDDTLITVSNRISLSNRYNEICPLLNRNNIRNWIIDSSNGIQMTNLPPCRGLWAFTTDSMILLGENYIARIPHYPTLQSMQYFPNYSFKKIIFSSHDTGFVIGRNITTNRGIILRTTDGGLTWKEQQLISCPPINDIAAITSQTLLAACNEGVLLRTETGGSNPVGITQGQEAIYATVYPNPANGGFTISVPGKSYDFTIYNGQGQNLTQGNSAQKTEVHCEDWSSGIYMVLLSIDGTQQVHKVQVTH